ncbi:hypothetical protein [Microcystis aeruginosa]|uniref:hypothetical protein n=1 Tax=Microcystis aeruginosa TaxID=1126 RepID=UPI000776A339|nr:hypothetical protein [Microcystis aeruginosa]KXS91934.1 hypothetical protein OA58_09000 [Microcystis aeruginosa NIES-88]BCU10881.1 hypothetical protein MAN88_14450 [Microcystis aeruginosa]
MKLTTAIISSNPREVTTKFGQRTVIDAIRTDTNETIAIWRPPNDRYVQKLGKNDRVSIAIDEKGKLTLVEEESPASSEPSPSPSSTAFDRVKASQRSLSFFEPSPSPSSTANLPLSLSEKKQIASYIQEMAKLYGFCLQQADSLGAIDKDRQAIATTLFLSAQKKFNL